MTSPTLTNLVALNLTYVFLLKVMSLVLAYLTIRLGYTLLAAGAKGEFKFSATFHGAKATLASVSPGLLFVLLGIALALYAVGVKKVTTYEASPTSAKGAPPSARLPPEVKR